MIITEQQSRFDSWLHQHRGITIKVARSFTSTPEDFEDLSQEILLQIWKSIPRFKTDCKVSTWIYRVALNRALLWQKSESKRHRVSRDIHDQPPPLPLREDSSVARIEELYRALRKLRKHERAIILLALEGLSYREIAEITAITESNVGARLSRIKRQLHQHLTNTEDNP